jgi:hypothetical protein
MNLKLRTVAILSFYTIFASIGVTWGGGARGKNALPLPIFVCLRIIYFGYCVEEGQIKKRAECGGKECMYIKDWLKPTFPTF